MGATLTPAWHSQIHRVHYPSQEEGWFFWALVCERKSCIGGKPQYCSLSLFLCLTCSEMGGRLEGCVFGGFGGTMDGGAMWSLLMFSEVVKRRELVCHAFLLNATEVTGRRIGNLRVGNHLLCWNGEKQCPGLQSLVHLFAAELRRNVCGQFQSFWWGISSSLFLLFFTFTDCILHMEEY